MSIEHNGSCWDEAPFGPGESNGLLCELKSGHAGAHRAADAQWTHRAGRGEPSDEQVAAALDAFTGSDFYKDYPQSVEYWEKHMRAALRAAGWVRP